MADYLSVVTRYVDGANCSGVSYFGIFSDEDEPMNVSIDNADTDEQVVARLIEFGNLSAEERQQALVNQEEVVVEELVQALVTQDNEIVVETVQTPNEKEVVISPVVRTEEAQEKEVEVSQPGSIRYEGEPSNDKDEEESSSSEGEHDQNARTIKPLPFPILLLVMFMRIFFILSTARIHTKVNPIQSMAADSQDDSSNEGSSADGEPSRRGDGVTTGTISKRAPTNDENPRPTKRGGGRSGSDRGGRSSSDGRGGQSGSDRGGRTNGGDRGGRSSGSGRGVRALPPYRNLLTDQDMTNEGMSYEGTRFPIDPRVKSEEQ
ncbi:keratin, type I cytoskeletal 9-like [Impatiens glandulifera]|uniref:keratin, type I cytoskeletal 9-like n=1 Tax=Impatiens glandulifera TaxID=253017 RepID=UPI001FB05BB3|nr:keratin, type I cytoskeletal 9-like [Impatiens glandulifera]